MIEGTDKHGSADFIPPTPVTILHTVVVTQHALNFALPGAEHMVQHKEKRPQTFIYICLCTQFAYNIIIIVIFRVATLQITVLYTNTSVSQIWHNDQLQDHHNSMGPLPPVHTPLIPISMPA